MDIKQLELATGVPARQIRYLISGRFIPGPDGSRTQPHYGEQHVAAILAYAERRRHLKPAQIRALDQATSILQAHRDGDGDGSLQDGSLQLAPGVHLVVRPDALPHDLDTAAVGDILAAILNHYRNIKDQTDAS